jgi:hypothetical protein
VTRPIRSAVIGTLTRLTLEFPAPTRRPLVTPPVSSGGALLTATLIALATVRALPTLAAALGWTFPTATLIALATVRTLPTLAAALGWTFPTATLIALATVRTLPTLTAALGWTFPTATLITVTAGRALPALRALAIIAVATGWTGPAEAARWPPLPTLAGLTIGPVSTVVRRAFAPGLTLVAGSVSGLLSSETAAGPPRRLARIALRPAVALCFFVVGHDTSFSKRK